MAVDVQYMRGLDKKRRPPIVRYKQRARFDQTLTERNGRSTFVDEDVAEITSPDGGVTLEKPVAQFFAEMDRNPGAYGTWAPAFKQMYQDWKAANNSASVNGTHVKNWPLVSPGQCETLVNAGLPTIEAVAEMSDDLAAAIDGGAYLRSKARYWINASEDIGGVAAEVSALRAENETLQAQVNELSKKLAELRSENERLTQHFTGKEGYDVIAGRVQPVGLQSVQAAQVSPAPPAESTAPPAPPAPEPQMLSLDQAQALSMGDLRAYCYEHDVKPSNSKDETIERLKEAGQLAA